MCVVDADDPARPPTTMTLERNTKPMHASDANERGSSGGTGGAPCTVVLQVDLQGNNAVITHTINDERMARDLF